MDMKQAHATKRGPGRFHKNGTTRGGKRDRVGGVGQFSAGLANSRARRQLDALQRKHPNIPRDEHGAFTMIGDPKRKWLAGVSARRGF